MNGENAFDGFITIYGTTMRFDERTYIDTSIVHT